MSRKTFKLDSSREHGWVECEALSRIPWLIHGFSTRDSDKKSRLKSGSSNLTATASDHGWGFLSDMGGDGFLLASVRQKHSAIIYCVSARRDSLSPQYELPGYGPPTQDCKQPNPFGDALITNHAGILLSVRVADCMPILLVDYENRAVAAVHAGWRGALARIVEKTAGEMRRAFHSRPENLIAAIGPSIRGCCYEVGEEVVDAFCGRFACAEKFFRKGSLEQADAGMANRRLPLFFSQSPPGHQLEEHSGTHLDLVAVARYQLEHAGVPPAQIHVAEYCTACRNDLFYSYRKEGNLAGRIMAVVGIRPAQGD